MHKLTNPLRNFLHCFVFSMLIGITWMRIPKNISYLILQLGKSKWLMRWHEGMAQKLPMDHTLELSMRGIQVIRNATSHIMFTHCNEFYLPSGSFFLFKLYLVQSFLWLLLVDFWVYTWSAFSGTIADAGALPLQELSGAIYILNRWVNGGIDTWPSGMCILSNNSSVYS